MPYAKVNPSGCTERYGLVQVRLDLCLEAGDVRYDDPRFYVIDETSRAFLKGYAGKVDADGVPLDGEQYAAWEASLPRIWLATRCFHHHMIYLDPYTLRDEQITDAIAHHLPNFYKAWGEEWDKVAGGMRHGFDVATRRPRPTRFNVTQPELYAARKAECLARVDVLAASPLAFSVDSEGQTFPSTDIDVGSAAENRISALGVETTQTLIDYNNAANATGSLDTIETYWDTVGKGNSIKAGTFADGGSYAMTCRDAQVIGEVAAGYNSDTGLDISVSTGDYIGLDERNGIAGCKLDRAISKHSGILYAAGQYCDPTDSATFTFLNGCCLSLYGTGDTGATAYNESATFGLGMALTGNRDAGYLRVGTMGLGAALSASRAATFGRTGVLGLGAALAVSRLATFGRSVTHGLGMALSAVVDTTSHYVETVVFGLGMALSATRQFTSYRTATTTLGMALSATREYAGLRASTLGAGLALSASRTFNGLRIAATGLGMALSAVRTAGYGRASTLGAGLALTAARLAGFGRTTTHGLGMALSASRAVAFGRSVTHGLGMALSAVVDTTSHYVETVVFGLGMALSATRQFTSYRTATTTLGMALSATREYAGLRASTLGAGLAFSVVRTAAYARSATLYHAQRILLACHAHALTLLRKAYALTLQAFKRDVTLRKRR